MALGPAFMAPAHSSLPLTRHVNGWRICYLTPLYLKVVVQDLPRSFDPGAWGISIDAITLQVPPNH